MFHFTKSQYEALVSTARKHSEMHALMFETAFVHGFRVSELLTLTRDNFNGEMLVVRRAKNGKTTAQTASKELIAYSKTMPRGAKLFLLANSDAHHSHRRAADRLIKKYGTEAGLPAHLLHMHILRHSCAHAMLDGGAPLPAVQQRLGHRSGASTMMYLQVDDSTADKAFFAAIGRKQ